MHSRRLLAALAGPAVVLATLNPALSNTKGYQPKRYNCALTKKSDDIQAAECSHNTRTSKKQTFAVFVTDHKHDKSHGAPYGSCSAYTCDPPTTSEMETNADAWSFFWSDSGVSNGFGTGCIKDPETGICGCENSDGRFVPGGNNCH